MSTTAADRAPAGFALSPRAVTWHRPLLWLSFAMAGLVVVGLIGLVVDPRVLTGAPLWAKPLKFAISILLYSLTLSWLLGLGAGGRRLRWWAGTVTAVFLGVEMVIIAGAAAAGVASHFLVSTPFHAALWSVMAVSIVIVWAVMLLVAVLLMRVDLGDPARSLAIRSGALIAVLGMGLAFLMTGPTADQLDSFQGVAGAHTVGVPDGGPGLPILGWSIVAGDLRIPHFVGMHALQLLPLAALLLEQLARRMPVLRAGEARAGVLRVLVGLYLGVLALLTGQALAGQSIVRPDALVLSVALALVAGASAACAGVLWRARVRPQRAAPVAGSAVREPGQPA